MNKLLFLATSCTASFDCVKDCGGADILRILKFVFILIDLVLFIVPMGLIVMIILDFSKNVIANKEDDMKKNVNMVIKRIIYCMVIFLVPTIVNFAVNFVGGTGDNIAAKAACCIDYAKNRNLSNCEVNYDTLEKEIYRCHVCDFDDGRESIYVWNSKKPADDYNGCTSNFYIDMTKTSKNTCKSIPQCYKCADNDDILVWSFDRPAKGTNGCSSNFSTMYNLDTEEKCNIDTAKKCYECINKTGYVLAYADPGRGFAYDSNSFRVTPNVTHCNPGFFSSPVERCNCTESGCDS